MLSYDREYRTLEHIGFDYRVREVEDVLIKSKKFSLPSKRALCGFELGKK